MSYKKVSKERLFKSVVAQFIGRVCLMNQATTRIWRRSDSNMSQMNGRTKLSSLKDKRRF
jgi:hypothetical protein